MIQRSQSLYLLSAMTALALMFFFPIAVVVPNEALHISLYITGVRGVVYTGANTWFIGFSVFAVLLMGGMAFALFSYRNRKRQLLVARLVSLGLVLFVGLLFLGIGQVAGDVNPGRLDGPSMEQYQWAVYMPLLSVVFMSLAQRGIRKDEALVRSADRLR